MSLRSDYRKAIKKHTPDEILAMYRNNKIDLNEHEWKNLHRKIDKQHQIVYGIKITSIIAVLICLLVIVFVSINTGSTYQEKIYKCRKVYGHVCTKYEIEEMIKNGNNNRGYFSNNDKINELTKRR